MLKFILVFLFPSLLFAGPILVTDKTMKSRDVQKICKELNWKLAAMSCGQAKKPFKDRAVYENCKNDLVIIAQVRNVPTEDATEAGPHRSCTVKATQLGKVVWQRRHRVYSDRVVSEIDKHSDGHWEREVITPEGRFSVQANNDKTLVVSSGTTKFKNLSEGDYFTFIQGKQSLVDLTNTSEPNRIPANVSGK